MALSLELANSFIASIYEAALDSKLWPEIVGQLANALKAEESLMFSPRLSKESNYLFLSPHQHIDPSHWREYDTYYWQLDVWAMECVRKGLLYNGSVVHGDDLIERDQLRKTEIYNDMYKPHMMGIEVVMGACVLDKISPSESTPFFLNFFRTSSAPSFDRNEEQFIRLLLPHFERAIHIRRQLSNTKAETGRMFSLFEALPTGVMLTTGKGGVIYLNQSGEGLLKKVSQVTVNQNHLVSRCPRLTNSIQNAFRRASNGIGSTIFIQDEASSLKLSCNFSPIDQEKLPLSFNEAKVMVTINAYQDEAKSVIGDFAKKYRLTPAETRVVSHLISGLSTLRMTSELCISMNTLRTQLKTIYSKTDSKNQRDLVRLFYQSTASVE